MAEVEREIRALESQYGLTSADFCRHPFVEEIVSEFDAIEWNFLLMQRAAHEESHCDSAVVFMGRSVTLTDAVDVPAAYGDLAA